MAPYAAPTAGPGLGQGRLDPGSERSQASMAHWLPILTSFVASGWIGSLIVLLTNGERSPFVRRHARQSLNFELTLIIAYFVSALLVFVGIGVLLIPAVWVWSIVAHLQAAQAASRGEDYTYKGAIQFLA